MNGRLLRGALAGALLLYCCALVVNVADMRNDFQWDFTTYYYAARAYAAGENPYDYEALSRIAGIPIRVKFIYLPSALILFRPFSTLGYTAAFYAYLAMKCVLAAALVVLWRRGFLQGGADLFFYVFCLFGFNGALYADIKAGNISTIEQFVLWCAFYAFVKGRMLPFCLLLVAVSSLKISPILFLALLWCSEDRRRAACFMGSLALFAAIVYLSYRVSPVGFAEFIRGAASVNTKGGILNPSSFWLFRDACALTAMRTGLAIPEAVPGVLWACFTGAIGYVTARACGALASRRAGDREMLMVCITSAAYALLLPRFKDYSYILLLLPTYLLIRNIGSARAYVLLLVMAMVPSPATGNYYVLPVYGIAFHRLLWPYYPLVLAFIVWLLYAHGILRNPDAGPFGRTAAPPC